MRYLPLLFLFPFVLSAQPDAYHQQLIEYLGTAFSLPTPTYPLGDTEAGINERAYNYGSAAVAGDATDQDFTIARQMTIAGGLTNPWDAGYGISTARAIRAGDKLLTVIYLRAPAEGGGRVTINVERSSAPFTKEFSQSVDLGPEWRRYLIPISPTTDYAAGGLQVALHLGFREQVVEVGGLTMLNFEDNVTLDQLPSDLNNEDYGGFEADADWRAPAAQRIDELRKADLSVVVMDGDQVVPDASIEIKMTRHQFEFGTAVKACRFPGNSCASADFNERIFNLDGEGHGFNTVTFENDLKWPGWEEEWISPNEETLATIDYLNERGITIRGHNLVWPGWGNLPSDMRSNQDNPDYLRQRIDDHLVALLETNQLGEKILDWDVLNETATNTDLAEALGSRDIYADIFKRARELAPDADLYINDYVTLTLRNQPGTTLYDRLQRNIGELIDAGAPIDGIGFQAHIGTSPNSIYEVLGTYDDFATKYGLKAKVTEFDLPPTVSEELAASYLVDFFTATFSHPSMEGIVFWNWWDVDTWANPGMNFYDRNWNATPSKDAFVDLVYGEWWTEESMISDAQGMTSVRGFKGDYEIAVGCGDSTVTTTVTLDGNKQITVDCKALLVSNAPTLFPEGVLSAAPNPAVASWKIATDLSGDLSAKLRDATGRIIWSGSIRNGFELTAPTTSGLYHLYFTDGKREGSLTLIRR